MFKKSYEIQAFISKWIGYRSRDVVLQLYEQWSDLNMSASQSSGHHANVIAKEKVQMKFSSFIFPEMEEVKNDMIGLYKFMKATKRVDCSKL